MREYHKDYTYLFGSYERDNLVIDVMMGVISLLFIGIGVYSSVMYHGSDDAGLTGFGLRVAWELSLTFLCLILLFQVIRASVLLARGYSWDYSSNGERLSFNLDIETAMLFIGYYCCFVIGVPVLTIAVTTFLIVAKAKMSLWMISLSGFVILGGIAILTGFLLRRRTMRKIEVLTRLRGD